MLFTSLTFIVFLVVVFALYWSLPWRRGQNLLLAVASYVFYAWWDPRFCALMFLHCLVDFTIAQGLSRIEKPRGRKVLLLGSILFNLGLLGTFKYFHFFQDNLVALAAGLGFHLEPWSVQIVLPVGISFYTFQSLGYTIDVYRRRLEPARNLIDYLAFVAFFPVLIAGPIERAVNLLPQFARPRRFDHAAAVAGCRLILVGFAKKLLLADNLARVVTFYYQSDTAPYVSGGQLLLATVCFAFQIYCDFSAYSDIAIGTARLLGFSLMRNFAYPYFSVDLVEFWRRWHISLSSWFRDYVYIPLGGSRGSKAALVRNLFVTFLLSGLWHGASWNFVLWGAFHGVGVAFCTLVLGRSGGRGSRRPGDTEEVPGGEGLLPSPRALAGMAATFAYVCVGWVFFRAATLGDALVILKRMATRPFTPFSVGCMGLRTPLALVAGLVLVEWLQRRKPDLLALDRIPRPARWLAYTSVLWLTLYWHTSQAAPFIYFQF
jgi:D-alanyl-lipoteichoic acid acyltransferase DltB (MBOAT superfamily)